MKKITFLATFLVIALFANAYDLTYTYDEPTLTAVVTGCSDNTITAVEIPATVTYAAKEYAVVGIGTQAFLNFSALATITIPNSVTSIGKEAFLGTAWYTSQPANGLAYAGKCAYKYNLTFSSTTNETLDEGTVGIADECFMGKGYLNSVTMPNSLTHIGMDAFNGCFRMTSADIPTSVTTIGARAFQGCGFLTSANISNVTSIEEYAFAYCNGITSVTLSTALTTIGKGAFEGCSGLTSLTLPEGVTTIGVDGFFNCTALTELSLPSSLTAIARWGFGSCTALAKITVKATTPPTIEDYTFLNVTTSIPVYVPVGTEAAYQAAEYWSEFTNFAPIPVAIQPITVIDGVFAHDGKIVIENSANLPISIYDAAGRLVTQTSTNLTDYSVPQAGVYIVKVGTDVMKVVVK